MIKIEEKTFREWMQKNFSEQELQDIVDHGVDTGMPSLTYYEDTVFLFETFKQEIFEALVDDMEDFGYANIYEFLAAFGEQHMPRSYEMFANQLTWYMAERTARELTEE